MIKYQIVTQLDSVRLIKNGKTINEFEPSDMTLPENLGILGEAIALHKIYELLPEEEEIILVKIEA